MTRPEDIPADVWEMAIGLRLDGTLSDDYQWRLSDDDRETIARTLLAYGQRRADEATERARPKVKTLEWKEITSPREDGPPEPTGDVEADTLIGCYSISIDEAAVDEGGVDWKWSAWTPFDSLGHFCEIDDAKAAAQADYEARILSALVQP